MMRALAQFIMSGRWRAAMVAMLGSWLPLITPATVGLVSLRQGALEGLLVVGWAVLPAFAALWLSDVSDLMIYATVAVMLVVWLAALYLRVSRSWAQTLMVLVASATLAALALLVFVPDVGTALTETLGALTAPPEAETDVPAVTQSTSAASGVLAYLIALSTLLALLVSRWWQALLYNPGGFQAEIHDLRLSPLAALTAAGATAYCLVRGGGYLSWASVFSLPLIMAGIGLVHWLVRHFRLGLMMLVVFYLALLLVRPLLFTVATLAFVDSWLSLRHRFKSTQ